MGFSCDKTGSRFNFINGGSQESIRMEIAIVVVFIRTGQCLLITRTNNVTFFISLEEIFPLIPSGFSKSLVNLHQ